MNSAPIIETARLRLRPHRPDDLDPLFRIWSDERVYRTTIGFAPDREACWMRLLRYEGLWALLGFGYWALELKAGGSYVGNLGFADFKRDLDPGFGGRPEAGWMLDPGHWHQGLASEALAAIFAWLDAGPASGPSVCMIAPDNAPSFHLARKAGFHPYTDVTYRGSAVTLLQRARR